MAKEKQTQKMLAMALAASVAAGAMPIPAFADVVTDKDSTTETTTDGTTEKSTTITGDGTADVPTVKLEVNNSWKERRRILYICRFFLS